MTTTLIDVYSVLEILNGEFIDPVGRKVLNCTFSESGRSNCAVLLSKCVCKKDEEKKLLSLVVCEAAKMKTEQEFGGVFKTNRKSS